MKRLTLLCVCMSSLSFGSWVHHSEANEKSAEYQIYIIDPPINNHTIQEHRPLPPVCKPGTTISMMA